MAGYNFGPSIGLGPHFSYPYCFCFFCFYFIYWNSNLSLFFTKKVKCSQRDSNPCLSLFPASCERIASTWDLPKAMSHLACRPRVTSREKAE